MESNDGQSATKWSWQPVYTWRPYILAASAENKNKKSMFLFYTEEESLPKSLRVILLQQDA